MTVDTPLIVFQGLINAIAELAPHAEHRNCARHVHQNWKKKHNSPELKTLFWKVMFSNYEAEYKKNLEALKKFNLAVYDDFIKQCPQYFYRAFISTVPKCDVVTSNLLETFNGYICLARTPPIIKML